MRGWLRINPIDYVPALALENGETLTENVAILSWIADQAKPASLGPLVRYRVLEALAYISAETHNSFKPYFTQLGHNAAADSVLAFPSII